MSSEIQPIVRSFTIIEYLASSEGARSLREIASACSLPPSTTHRLLNTLCLLDYVVHESNGDYPTKSLGSRAILFRDQTLYPLSSLF